MPKKPRLSLRNYAPGIIIKLKGEVDFPNTENDVGTYLQKKKILPWKKLEQVYPGIGVSRLFTSVDPDKLDEMVKKAKENNPKYKVVNLNYYLAVNCPVNIKKEALLNDLWKFKKAVEYAYIEGKLSTGHAVAVRNPRSVNQHHLDQAPWGVNARYAQNLPGGDGSNGASFVDIEEGWRLTHEDFQTTNESLKIDLISGVNGSRKSHGTGVLGIVAARDNNPGGIGIVPFVKASVVSAIRSERIVRGGPDVRLPDAISAALGSMNPGDVLLIELQSEVRTKRMPCEIEQANFDVISMGVSHGFIIIEIAGNGGTDLDGVRTDNKLTLKRWNDSERRIENPDFCDSGAIMVGASSSDVPHSRRPLSNFGSRIDCFAWGENINTASARSNDYYIEDFDGTSGAGAIIAGVALSIQSMYFTKNNRSILTPFAMRALLSNPDAGTKSASTSDAIGPMPDLQKIGDAIQDGSIRKYILPNNPDRGTGGTGS